jgi:DNA-binding NarL/FixJ family response regulator
MISFASSASRAVGPSRASSIRVLLADDHAVTLWGLRQLIESAGSRMTVSGTASTRHELLSHPALDATDVVLLDLSLKDASALECLPRLVSDGLKVVILTGDVNPIRHREAVLGGARGVVLKSQSTDTVLEAIERVHAGEVFFDGSLMSMLLDSMPNVAPGGRRSSPDTHVRRIESLTTKEREVVRAVVSHRGAKSLAVAEALHMSEHTLRNHLTVIYSKLCVRGRLELYVFATEHGLAPHGGVS